MIPENSENSDLIDLVWEHREQPLARICEIVTAAGTTGSAWTSSRTTSLSCWPEANRLYVGQRPAACSSSKCNED